MYKFGGPSRVLFNCPVLLCPSDRPTDHDLLLIKTEPLKILPRCKTPPVSKEPYPTKPDGNWSKI